MENFYKKIFSLFKFYGSKESREFYLPVILGILYKLNYIAIFIIPIQAIKSVSEGTLSSKIRNIFNYLKFPIPPDNYVFLFFLISIFIILIILIIIHKLKDICIKKIKYRLTLRSKKLNSMVSRNDYYKFIKRIEKTDNLIKDSEDFFFCLILSVFILIYDLQIAFIIFFGGFIYLIMILTAEMYINRNKNANNIISLHNKNDNKYLFQKLSNIISNNKSNLDVLKPIASTLIMILIMSAINKRIDMSISIIFIFVVRIFQNSMLKSIEDLNNRM